MTKASRILLSITLFCISGLIIWMFAAVYSFYFSPARSQSLETKYYEVQKSMPLSLIAHDLEHLGVVSNSSFFYWYVRLSGNHVKIKAGDYRLTTQMTPAEVLKVLISGVSFGHPITIPEGYNVEQIAGLIKAINAEQGQEFLELCTNQNFIQEIWTKFQFPGPAPQTLEGYLYPNTYFLIRKAKIRDVVMQMVKGVREIFTHMIEARAAEIKMSLHKIITLASIIEKETGAPNERAVISSVFHNRLKKHMRLQSDPTVIYGVKDYNGNITKKHLSAQTQYNTYVISGLPPGPIANPGKEAILAALYPAESSYLYFVSHNDGTHEFTSTYDEHKKAVAYYQLDKKMREGKSWRNLNSKIKSIKKVNED